MKRNGHNPTKKVTNLLCDDNGPVYPLHLFYALLRKDGKDIPVQYTKMSACFHEIFYTI